MALILVVGTPLAYGAASPPTQDSMVREQIRSAVTLYEESGLGAITAAAGTGTSGGLYTFVLDRTTGQIVAHGANPDLVGMSAFDLTDPDKDIDTVNAELDAAGESWIRYVFENPDTGTDEFKHSLLVLHDGYVFGSGFYAPVVTLGAVVPLSGGASGYGQDIAGAIRLAADDFNADAPNRSAPGVHLELDIRDSETDTEAGVRAFADLYDSGVRLIAGPSIDGVAGVVMQHENAADALFASCCSVVPSLAADDTLIRVIASHDGHGRVLASTMRDAGADTIVMVGRDNPWINELLDAAADSFETLGGSVHESRISYSGAEYGQAIRDLSGELADLEASCAAGSAAAPGCGNTAVLYIGFEETAGFLELASSMSDAGRIPPGLDGVMWFGSDANTVTPKVASSPVAARFASGVGFTAVQPSVCENDITGHIRSSLSGDLGRDPSVYAYTAYDSVMLLGDAIIRAGSAGDIHAVKEALVSESVGASRGALGPITMNQYGDLDSMHYGVWEFSGGGWSNTAPCDAADDAVAGSDPGQSGSAASGVPPQTKKQFAGCGY